MLDNDLLAFLIAALFVGVLLAGPRRIFRSPWLWGGAFVMVAMWSPYLVWQARHSFPELTIARAIANGSSGTSAPRWQLIPFQFVLAGIAVTPLWVSGLVRLVRDPNAAMVPRRPDCIRVLVVVFLVEAGKPYYLSGLLAVLYAAGAEPVMRWWSIVRGRWAIAVAAAVVVLVVGSAGDVADRPDGRPARDADRGAELRRRRDRRLAHVCSGRSPRRTTPSVRPPVVIASNYGEAGAIERYRDPVRLPLAYGVQNSNWLWGPPPAAATQALAIGFDRSDLTPVFRTVRLVSRLDNHLGVDDDEQGEPVWICTGLTQPWSVAWRRLRDYG